MYAISPAPHSPLPSPPLPLSRAASKNDRTPHPGTAALVEKGALKAFDDLIFEDHLGFDTMEIGTSDEESSQNDSIGPMPLDSGDSFAGTAAV